MRLALRAEHMQQRFLGAGLADRSGDGDAARLRAGARRAAEPAQGLERILDDEQPMRLRHGEALGDRDDGGRALLDGRVHEVVPVAVLALDGEEEVARLRACACRSRRR